MRANISVKNFSDMKGGVELKKYVNSGEWVPQKLMKAYKGRDGV